MRSFSEDFAAHIAGEATTLCRCWCATRRDGAVLGFTDHDADLSFDGTLFRAGTGLSAAETTTGSGFAVGGGEAAGALGSDSLTEADLAAGLWDSAKVEVFLVNWRDVSERARLAVSEIGEVRRTGESFTAELRSLAHRLEAKRGRLFAQGCDAAFGDARCGMDTTDPRWRGVGTVSAAPGAFSVLASGLETYDEGAFTGGLVTWTSGANAGLHSEVREHRRDAGGARLSFWSETPFDAAPGDAFFVVAGCDKRFETCRDRFDNLLNFRGFPHMPGTDRALAYPNAEDGNLDGGSLFK